MIAKVKVFRGDFEADPRPVGGWVNVADFGDWLNGKINDMADNPDRWEVMCDHIGPFGLTVWMFRAIGRGWTLGYKIENESNEAVVIAESCLEKNMMSRVQVLRARKAEQQQRQAARKN